MKPRFSNAHSKGEAMKNSILCLSAIVIFAGTTAVAAQSVGQEDVTVFAPYVVTKTTTRDFKSSPVTTIKMSRDISYHGLDLTSDADVATLEARVKQAAEDVCNQLDKGYPKSGYVAVAEDKKCAAKAAENALDEVRTVVAAVRSNSQSAQAK